MSIQALQEFYVTVTRKIVIPLPQGTARQIAADLANWRLHTPDAADLLLAIDVQHAHWLSFWDAMSLQSAARLVCTQLLSEDLSHGRAFGAVMVVNPFID